jgi:hypothetical protein
MFVYAADVVIANQRWPARSLYVIENEASATLWNCDFYALKVAPEAPIAVAIQSGASAGVKLQNTTYTNSLIVVHVEATNGAEVYSDNGEIVFRYSKIAYKPMFGDNGKLETALNLSDSSATTLQFISASDGEELIKV